MGHFGYPVRREGMAVGDPQGALPWGWCPVCGMEIWRKEAALCQKCEEREKKVGKKNTVYLLQVLL